MSGGEREYVLGTNDAELVRLGLQHRLWSAQAFAAWERGGFQPGQTLLDVGCGPGFATFDLAHLVGTSGRVIAVDVSERFVAYLRRQAEARGAGNIDVRIGDVQSLNLTAGSIDGAYNRWVICFVSDPESVVAAVARALRPGGVFVIQDYYNYGAIRLCPHSDAFAGAIVATERSWRDSGGDPEIGCRLPAMLARCGFEIRSTQPLVRIARPGEPLWQWPNTFFGNFVPALVAKGYLTPGDQEAFARDWAARSGDPSACLYTPAMVEIIAVKR